MLSPLLFNILLEVVIALALEGNGTGATISGTFLSNLLFADDISCYRKSSWRITVIEQCPKS